MRFPLPVALWVSVVMSTAAGAQAPAVTQGAGTPRALAGRCGSANWVCVSQCIDTSCVDRCLAEGCEKALDSLQACAARSKCGADDSDCVEKACGKQCGRSFEPAPRAPEKETADPCAEAAMGSGKVPKKMVGTWSLEAASVRPEERDKVVGQAEVQDVKPRPDYERTLVVTSTGCFLLSTKLENATLGKGSTLQVRSWGPIAVNEKEDTVELRTQDGQAVGTVCGKPRVVALSKGKFQRPLYEYELEGDVLAFTAKTDSKQTFQFRRQAPEKVE